MLQAKADKYQQPYLTELQHERPCCECGTTIPRDKATVCCHLPLEVNGFLTIQLIVWCDKCWTEHYSPFLPLNKVKDMTIGGTHKD